MQSTAALILFDSRQITRQSGKFMTLEPAVCKTDSIQGWFAAGVDLKIIFYDSEIVGDRKKWGEWESRILQFNQYPSSWQ